MSMTWKAAVAGSVAALVALTGCGTSGGGGSSEDGATTLSLVGFAVPEKANEDLQAAWAKTDDGRGVTWKTSYGASGDQSRAVESGLDADYVHFSLEGDVTRLVDADLVAKDWNAGEDKGIVSQSVVVLVVRKGNPKNIQGWADLARDDVDVVFPNPKTSGNGRYTYLAAWMSAVAADTIWRAETSM